MDDSVKRKPIAEYDFAAGEVLLFNKPKTWSSFNVVAKVRNLTRVKKVGHAGTLDPLATGLLILCTGKATKKINDIQGLEKEYETDFALGATTKSYDSEFPPENIRDTTNIDRNAVETALTHFVGEIEQVPPVFSAVKVNGRRAYKAARAGQKIDLRTRIVTVDEFSLLEYESPDHIRALIRCSKGTYIRSLVHDLGQILGVGGYIKELVRTRIGAHLLENAWEIDEFAQQIRALKASQTEQK